MPHHAASSALLCTPTFAHQHHRQPYNHELFDAQDRAMDLLKHFFLSFALSAPAQIGRHVFFFGGSIQQFSARDPAFGNCLLRLCLDSFSWRFYEVRKRMEEILTSNLLRKVNATRTLLTSLIWVVPVNLPALHFYLGGNAAVRVLAIAIAALLPRHGCGWAASGCGWGLGGRRTDVQ